MTLKTKVIFDNAVRALLGLSLAVNGYFINQTISTIDELEKRTRTLEVDIAVANTTLNIHGVMFAELRRKRN